MPLTTEEATEILPRIVAHLQQDRLLGVRTGTYAARVCRDAPRRGVAADERAAPVAGNAVAAMVSPALASLAAGQ